MNELVLKPIKGKKKFDEFFATARKVYLKDAVIYFTLRRNIGSDEKITLEYAVTVRKKNARKAVVRNRIKRLLRECLRQLASNETMSKKLVQFDKLIIVWSAAPSHPMLIRLEQVCNTVTELINKAAAGLNFEQKFVETQ